MEKTINCGECGKEFTFEENPRFPRKYCIVCSAKKKADFNKGWTGENGDAKPEVVKIPDQNTGEKNYTKKDNGVKKENGEYQSTVYKRTVAANSYEVGKAGNRFKLYFETPQELKDKINELKEAGFWDVPEDIITGE